MSIPPEVTTRVRELIKVDPSAGELARKFAAAGHSLYLVGGSVRDALLRRTKHPDLDFATDAPPDKVIEMVRGWHEGQWLVGVEFGTVAIMKRGIRMEITTFRGERYAEDSRKPAVTPVATIEDDLSRRDFTVNAMAYKLPEREFIDPFGGLRDLASKTLRTPLSPELSFSDDPLRMLRAARFAAALDTKPVPELVTAMKAQRHRLKIVSAERVKDELEKLLDTPKPSVGLDLATETGLSDIILPELPELKLEQDPIHRHKDVYQHTLAVVDKIAASDPDPHSPDTELRLAGLLHDIGKPATRRFGPEGVSFHHHEVVGAQIAERRLRALRFSGEQIETVSRLIFLHLRFHTFRLGWTDSAVRRYVRDAGDLFDRLNRLVRADCTTRNPFKARQLATAMDDLEERVARLAAEEDLKRIRPPLNGHDVMQHLRVPPGPIVGDAMDYLLEQRLDRGEFSREEGFRLLDAWAAEHGLK